MNVRPWEVQSNLEQCGGACVVNPEVGVTLNAASLQDARDLATVLNAMAACIVGERQQAEMRLNDVLRAAATRIRRLRNHGRQRRYHEAHARSAN
jgi:hypothetical protein